MKSKPLGRGAFVLDLIRCSSNQTLDKIKIDDIIQLDVHQINLKRE